MMFQQQQQQRALRNITGSVTNNLVRPPVQAAPTAAVAGHGYPRPAPPSAPTPAMAPAAPHYPRPHLVGHDTNIMCTSSCVLLTGWMLLNTGKIYSCLCSALFTLFLCVLQLQCHVSCAWLAVYSTLLTTMEKTQLKLYILGRGSSSNMVVKYVDTLCAKGFGGRRLFLFFQFSPFKFESIIAH